MQTFISINMQIIPKSQMRPEYADSWGDYWVDEDGTLQIRAVLMPDVMFSHYILTHEHLEAIRCYRDGISLGSIEKWDSDHSDHPDPGCLPDAPYHSQHQDSMLVEKVCCHQDGYAWEEYYNSEPVEA